MKFSYSILVVDDDPECGDLLREALRDEGTDVSVVPDGGSAIARWAAGGISLMLLDVRLPGMSGIEVCQHLRAQSGGQSMPIIFVSAHYEQEDRRRAFEAGATDYVPKPFHLSELLARVQVQREILRRRVQLEERNARLKEENEMRLDLERLLAGSLDRALLVVDGDRRIRFQTRVATSLLFKHFPGHVPDTFPEETALSGSQLVVRSLEVSPAGSLLRVIWLEERMPEPGPASLSALGLTPREAEVLFWILRAKTNPEIAIILGTSRRTVATHVEHILRKLGVENRAAAAMMALASLSRQT